MRGCTKGCVEGGGERVYDRCMRECIGGGVFVSEHITWGRIVVGGLIVGSSPRSKHHMTPGPSRATHSTGGGAHTGVPPSRGGLGGGDVSISIGVGRVGGEGGGGGASPCTCVLQCFNGLW